MEKYHKDKKFPNFITLPKGTIRFTLSDHARQRSKENNFELPKSMYIIEEDIIEVKVKNKEIWRVLVRQKYNDTKDICVVFNMNFKLITAWLIDQEDNHSTLDASEYTNLNI